MPPGATLPVSTWSGRSLAPSPVTSRSRCPYMQKATGPCGSGSSGRVGIGFVLAVEHGGRDLAVGLPGPPTMDSMARGWAPAARRACSRQTAHVGVGRVVVGEACLQNILVSRAVSSVWTSRPMTASQSFRTSWSFFTRAHPPSRQTQARRRRPRQRTSRWHARRSAATGPEGRALELSGHGQAGLFAQAQRHGDAAVAGDVVGDGEHVRRVHLRGVASSRRT